MATIKKPVKWTAPKVIQTLTAMAKYLKDNETTFTITQLSTAFKLYPKWYLRMKAMHPNNEKIHDMIDYLYAVCEGRIAEAGLNGLINPTFGIFILKTNYGHVETQYVQQNSTTEHTGDINVTIKHLGKQE